MALRVTGARRSKPSPDAMTLTEHLGELRRRLVLSVLALSAAAVIAFFLYQPMLHILQHPYCQVTHGSCQLYVTSPLDGLSLRIKMAGFGGLVLASPIILWQVWRFITPGLNPREKRYAIPFVATSIVLFLLGCALAYYSLPHALGFLEHIGGPSLKQIYNPNQYLSLVLLMMALFGATFEFPVILVALELAGVLSPKRLLSWWRYAVIAIVAVAAVFTPSADPFSMMVMAVPLIVFYFLAILVGKLLGR
jgi:sec-independent protein translocase protein TatC